MPVSPFKRFSARRGSAMALGASAVLLAATTWLSTGALASGPGSHDGAEDLLVFEGLVGPILEQGCGDCHGDRRPKARLNLVEHAGIMKGSRKGPAVAVGRADASTLIEVLELPLDHGLHMPPEGEPQLSPGRIAILGWWVDVGAPATGRVGDYDPEPWVLEAIEAWSLGDDEEGSEGGVATEVAGDELEETPTEGPAALGTPQPTERTAIGEPTERDYEDEVLPLLQRYCFECHGADVQKGDVQLDVLDPDMIEGHDAEHWLAALDMINGGEMPPRRAPQPSNEERRTLVDWMTISIEAARQARLGDRRVVMRRLNKAQYTNTLGDLLGVGVEFGRVLPDDGKSKMGFSNNGEVLLASPLHVDTYQSIARRALDQALALGPKPEITHYRVTLGSDRGVGKVGATTGGYQSVPLNPNHFAVEILDGEGQPKVGATEEEQKALDDIKRRITIGLRGSSQDRFRPVKGGMLLYSAVPHREKVPQSWQGPSPNLKLEMKRCFPEEGDFVMRVLASRGDILRTRDQHLVSIEDPTPRVEFDGETGATVASEESWTVEASASDERRNLVERDGFLVSEDLPSDSSARVRIEIPDEGYYQIDMVHPVVPPESMPSVRLSAFGKTLDSRPEFGEEQLEDEHIATTLGAGYFRAGGHHIKVGGPFFVGFRELVVTKLSEDHPLVLRLNESLDAKAASVADLVPALRAYVGTRTDDGMDYKTFDEPQEVHAPLGAPETYTFMGRLENLPIPEPESGDLEILSGYMLLGLWNDHLVKSRGETGPPLLVQQIEFEAPYYPAWPPASHTAIFFESPNSGDEVSYTREVLERFISRAFRRPATHLDVDRYMEFWGAVRSEFESYEESVREVLVAILCSPQFLFMVEPIDLVGDEGELPEWALANRLSYFLWNSPPDETLTALAARGQLRAQGRAQVDRMLDDPRAERFIRTFGREWLRMDRLEGMSINVNKHGAFTRFVKHDMAEETYRFLHHVVKEDLSLFTLIDSDFAMLNQNLAEFYGIEGVQGVAFRPVPITPQQGRGGLLSQGSFLVGHSDGTQPHPIKRAVWIKERILGDPPPPPPPNVPDLDPETPGFEDMTLKEQLEAHRDNPSCFDCHARLDPYGIVFEGYSAVGLFEDERKGRPVDTQATLPDGVTVDGVDELKAYIQNRVPEAFAQSLIEHLYAYALGRDVHFADEEELQGILEAVESEGYSMRSVIQGIVASPSFQRP